MRIEVLRRETLKPWPPTPDHLKLYKLSLLDQFVRPFVYTHMVLFYQSNPRGDHFSTSGTPLVLQRLKQSLSQALARFYPLAGRIRGNIFIDCRDDGVPFIEARIHGSLSTFLQNPDDDKLPGPFLPPKSELLGHLSPPLLLVQATSFACGGLAVGFYLSHKFGDGGTLWRFLKDWASLCHPDHCQTPLPAVDFSASSHFPPSVSAVQLPADESKRFAVSGERCITKRFVFNAPNIAALKAKAATGSHNKRQPTRTDVVTALTWRCAMKAARRTNRGVPMHFAMHELVNIRKRADLPFSENSVGNFVQYVSIELEEEESAEEAMELRVLAAKLREGVEAFDKREAKRLGGGGGDAAEEIFKSWKERKDLSVRQDLKLYTCTSALGFEFYEIDFGWGKPIWFSLESGSKLNNFIMLATARDGGGGGVEASVTLSEEDMALFERDPELLSFASPSNPTGALSSPDHGVSRL